MIKNKFIEIFISHQKIFFYISYILLLFIVINNNSNVELIIKSAILFIFLFLLNKEDAIAILITFYRLLFIVYFLFFIFYFLANDESSKIFANGIFTFCLLILPGYLLAYLTVLLRHRMIFIRNIFFNISIVGTFMLPLLGYRSGTINMTYTRIDIFLFLLIVIQLLIILYEYIKDEKLTKLAK